MQIDMSEVMKTLETEQGIAKAKAAATKLLIRDAMKEAGVSLIEVTFDGSGDSGQVEDVVAQTGVGVQAPDSWEKATVYAPHTSWERVEGEEGRPAMRQVEHLTTPLREAVEDFTYTALEGLGVDWYNNDGGFGTLTLTLVDGELELELDVSTRFAESNNVFFGDPTADDAKASW
jgi:hypothetical protein